MATYYMKLREFAADLFEIGAIKFGDYKTESGLMTPIYSDLKMIVSCPTMMETLASFIIDRTNKLDKYDIICGLPHTALPIATVVSFKAGIPMVMLREEMKENCNNGRLIAGNYSGGDDCLIIDDVLMTGSNILEAAKLMSEMGILCKNAFVIVDRGQGGETILKKSGIKMRALFTLTQLVGYLKDANCIDEDTYYKVKNYLNKTQITSIISNIKNRLSLSYSDRVQYTKNKVASRLFKLMDDKQTNLCVAADLTKMADILSLAEQVGPYICLLKTHIDIVEDFHPDFLKNLKNVAKQHNFILFEDRKFADIGHAVKLQCKQGINKISSWAELVTAHSLTGKGTLDGLKQAGSTNFGVFLLAETSSVGNVADEKCSKSTLQLAEQCSDTVTGIVCQNALLEHPGLIQLSPLVHLDTSDDALGQQYSTPLECAILERGADVVIVGKDITQSTERDITAKKYKDILWKAYSKRIS